MSSEHDAMLESYDSIHDSKTEASIGDEKSNKSAYEDEIARDFLHAQKRRQVNRRRKMLLAGLLTILSLAVGFLTGYNLKSARLQDLQDLHEKYQHLGNTVDEPLDLSDPGTRTQTSCKDPLVRREWRSLSSDQKQEYIDAVLCLSTIPSDIRDNGTLYDDFPWVHTQVSHMTHQSAQFFTWHREFVHTYKQTLRNRCNYKGMVPYWDWTLDWENIRSAPLWSPTLGFGGDGDPAGEETIGHGRCVRDGPFANMVGLFYASHDRPHCLSRGFSDFSGMDARPEKIDELLDINEYETFFLAVEGGPHNVVPRFVRGDFWSFSAPYDPVFFLHHAQLDRLWWMWQERGLPRRLAEYHGPAWANATVGATTVDILRFNGLTDDIPVSDVMDTQGGHLCYRY